jgi:PAS domain S-box-containing protein
LAGIPGANDLTAQPQQAEIDRFRLLVEAVTDYAIYMLDPAGIVSSWNPGAERFKGYRREEIVGRHFSQFYTPEDREAGVPQKALETAAREGRFESEGWRVRKDGTRFWASVVVDPVRDERGGLLGFAKITRDLTERRNAQIELEKAREAFFQSQKMEALGQLTGGIAHDFNNLLTAVLGSLEMLRKRLPDDPKLFQLLDNAVQGAERGAVLTQRMLAFARRQELKPEPLDLALLVRDLDGLLQRTLGPSVAIVTQLKDVRPALADANQLELAVLNLAVNARDAMPKGGTITIDVSEQVADRETVGVSPGAYVRLCVADTGEGMDEETLARATEPFFTTKGVGRGTGLGLSTVHGLMDQLGGHLRLHSRKGEGTTAELWLPVTEGEAVNTQPRPKPAADIVHEPPAERPLTVLAVDDDGLVLMNTSAMLEELGHRVIEASSGAQALALVRGDPKIDLIVTDYAMPTMTGSDLVGAIRAERPDLPVILATGYAELPAGAEVDALRLPKPFGQLELGRAISAATRWRETIQA